MTGFKTRVAIQAGRQRIAEHGMAPLRLNRPVMRNPESGVGNVADW